MIIIYIFNLNTNGINIYMNILYLVKKDTYFKKMYFGSSNESGVNIPDIKKITKSYGLKYSCISNSVELNSKLNKILKSDKAEIIEVKIDPKKHLYPKLTSQINSNGKMSTSPLEDLYPFIDRKDLKTIMISERGSKV